MAADPERLRTGLRFLVAAREDPQLRAQVRLLDPARGLGPAVELAVAAGFDLDAGVLREAHRLDWVMRRARHAPSSAATTVAVVNSASSST